MNVWLWIGLGWLATAIVAVLFVYAAHRKPTPQPPAGPSCADGVHRGIAEYTFGKDMVTERCLACGHVETIGVRGGAR